MSKIPMLRHSSRLLGVFALVVCLAASASAAIGCGDDDDGSDASGDAGSFAGETDAGDFLVGAVVGDEGHVSGYACNGARGVSEWFHGKVSDGKAELTSERGATLSLSVEGDAINGTFAPPPQAAASASRSQFVSNHAPDPSTLVQFTKTQPFSSDRVSTSDQGVFRASRQIDTQTVLAGWVQPRDPTAIVPGVELQGDPSVAPVEAAPLDIAALTADFGTVFGLQVGTLTAERLVPDDPGEGEVDVDEAPFTRD